MQIKNNLAKPGRDTTTRSGREALTGVSCLLLAHDEFEREGLRGLLVNRGIESVRSTPNFESAAQEVSRSKPHVIIAVAEYPPSFPPDVLVTIRKSNPDSGMIVLCKPALVRTYLPIVTVIGSIGRAGVKLLLLATLRNGDQMMATVDEVMDGHCSVETNVLNLLVHDQEYRPESLVDLLTEKELQVLEFASTGATNRNIAHRLNNSAAYVSNVLTMIFAKLRLNADADKNLRVLACRQFYAEFGVNVVGGVGNYIDRFDSAV